MNINGHALVRRSYTGSAAVNGYSYAMQGGVRVGLTRRLRDVQTERDGAEAVERKGVAKSSIFSPLTEL